ncbi:WW domain-binding protein 1-like isoform X2 [Heterodontus francisci]|uniref:WW domain-binding protein 1-like isoform X2 n=1 Tax=Heterodontus francisci TaxID=7792 RepID=UPI00355C7B9D
MDGGRTESAGPRLRPESQRGPGLPPHNLIAADRVPGPRAAPYTQQVGASCPGISNCGETGCCTYFYELWWLLASFKLPAYEEVSAQPSTPPPSYTSVQCQGVRSELTPSLSFNNCSSCSCSSSSPSSTSVSDTSDPSTSSNLSPPSDPELGPPLSSLDHTAEDVSVAISREAPSCSDSEQRQEEDETCLRHRRLTGDSGIEVCHCLIHEDDKDCTEESGCFLHDRPSCVGELQTTLLQPANSTSLCSCQLTEETLAPIFPM